MKTITLKEAHRILSDASSVVIDDSVVTYPALSELNGKDENQFLMVSWSDTSRQGFLKFCEGLNREVRVSGSSIFLFDVDNEEEGYEHESQITILAPKELE